MTKKLIAMASPILPGKMEQWKKFSNDLKTRYSKEYNESRASVGIQERAFLQSTPTGDLVIVTMEGVNPEEGFKKLNQKNDQFTKWFNTQVKEIHGLDLTKDTTLKLPELVVETKAVEEHVHA